MLPIDYLPLESREVEAIQHWFAAGAYLLVRECMEAQMVKAGESAISMMTDVSSDDEARAEAVALQAAYARHYQRVLNLLEAAAQGFYGEDESNKFEYLRMTAKIK